MKFKEFIKLYYSRDIKIIFLTECKDKMYNVLHNFEPREKISYKVTYFYGYNYFKSYNGGVIKIQKTYKDIPMDLPEWFVNKLKFKYDGENLKKLIGGM